MNYNKYLKRCKMRKKYWIFFIVVALVAITLNAAAVTCREAAAGALATADQCYNWAATNGLKCWYRPEVIAGGYCEECPTGGSCNTYNVAGLLACTEDKCGYSTILYSCNWDDATSKCVTGGKPGECNRYCTSNGYSEGYCFASEKTGHECDTESYCNYMMFSFDLPTDECDDSMSYCVCTKKSACTPDCEKRCSDSGCGDDPCASITKCEDYKKEQCTANPCKTKINAECELEGDLCKTKAGGGGGEGDSVIDKIKAAVKNLACTVYVIIYYTASGFVALVLLLSGVKWMTSDEAGGRIEARRRLSYAIIGLIVIILACPIINFFFANTDIVRKGPCDCGNLPFSGGGGGIGSLSKMENIDNLDTCTTMAECGSSNFCGDTTAAAYHCFPKQADGEVAGEPSYFTGDIASWTVKSIDGKPSSMCKSGFVKDGKCAKSSVVSGCSSAAGCDSDQYCGSEGFCHYKKVTGDTSECGSSGILGDHPDKMCKSGWCINGKCMATSNCDKTVDCDRHYNGYYCGSDGKCHRKVGKDGYCKGSTVVGPESGNRDEVCQLGYTCRVNDKCA